MSRTVRAPNYLRLSKFKPGDLFEYKKNYYLVLNYDFENLVVPDEKYGIVVAKNEDGFFDVFIGGRLGFLFVDAIKRFEK